MTCIRFNRSYASILYHSPVIASYLSKVAYFTLLYLHLALSLDVTPFELCQDLWHQKTRVPGLLCDIVSMILHLAILTQYRYVTDGCVYVDTSASQTCTDDGQTDRHMTMANTALV